jgi:O-antigen/teichoic acid export membrane protein
MSEPDSAARGPALLFWAQILGNAGLFVALLLVTRALGPTGRGTVAFITVAALVTAWVARLGVTEATVVFAAQRPWARPILLSNVLAFATGAALVGAALVCGSLLVIPGARPSGVGDPELAILALSILAAGLADAGYRFLLGCSRFREHALITITTSWVYPLLVAFCWAVFGLTVAQAALLWAVTQALRALLLFLVGLREGGIGRPNRSLLVESIVFGLRAWIGTLADSLNFRVDQILIALIASEATLGIYVVAVNVSEVLLYLPGATATALLPLVAGSRSEQRLEPTLRAFRSASLVALVTAVAAALVVPPLLPLVFGAPFEASVTPFLLLLPGVLGAVAMAVFSNALVASSLPSFSSMGPMTSFILGVTLDVALIPSFGASGAAAAASAAFLAGGATALAIYRAQAPFRLRELALPRPGDLEVLQALAAPLLRVHVARRGS